MAGKKRQAELAAAALILAKVNDKKSSARSSPQSTSGDLTSAQGEGTKMESNKVLSKEGTKRPMLVDPLAWLGKIMKVSVPPKLKRRWSALGLSVHSPTR